MTTCYLQVNRWSSDFWVTKTTATSTEFKIEIHGIPYQLWSSDLMHAVGKICGEVLCMDPTTLNLADLTAMKMKIRNKHGINFIPRSVKIHTKQGIYTAFITVVNR